MNTVNSFQYHRLRKRGKLGYNDDEDRDRHVTTAFHLKQFGNPQNVSANVAGMMAGTSSSASVCEQSFPKEAIENDAAQTENTGDDIAYPGRRQTVAAANARKKLQTTASAELVDRTSSMRVISLPSHRETQVL